MSPLEFTKTAETRDLPEASIIFPYPDDCGLDIKDIPFFIVYNGFDHYCGVKLPMKTYKDGCKELYDLLSKARAISDSLGQAVSAPIVKQVVKKASENSISSLYAVDQLMQSAHLVNLEEIMDPTKKKKRVDKDDKRRKTKSGKTSFTEFTCACGVPKEDKEDLKAHQEKRHTNNNWKCIIENCKFVGKESKRLKKHVQNQHFKEFYHFCKYCTYGTDERHLLDNHMSKKHQMGVAIPCTKLGCSKMFGSVVSRRRHEIYCKEQKIYECEYENCSKTFKRLENYNLHIKVVHTGEAAKVFCKVCWKTYQTKTSYKAHLRNNQCYPRDMDEIPEDELANIEKELQQEDEDIQVMDDTQEA